VGCTNLISLHRENSALAADCTAVRTEHPESSEIRRGDALLFRYASRSLNRLGAVAATIRDPAECVLLFECESRRQPAEPPAGARESGPAFRDRRIACDGGEFVTAPRDPASLCCEQLVPCGCTAHANELIRIVGWAKLARVDDVDLGALAGACGVLDPARWLRDRPRRCRGKRSQPRCPQEALLPAGRLIGTAPDGTYLVHARLKRYTRAS
jgi:hypothetical protein